MISSLRRLVLPAGLLICGLIAAAPVAAEPAELPVYIGAMVFPAIHDPAGPEEYSWRVELYEDQELKLIDEQHAEVLHESGRRAFLIAAELAHDAEGKAVPTSIAIGDGDGDVLTLTVHHAAGNPAAGGAPFRYPVIAGAPYEVGPSTVYLIEMPTAKPDPPAPAPTCVVPGLREWKLKAARHWLRQAQCGLGKVRGKRRPGAKVVKQSPAPGTELPAGARVAVKLG